MRPTRTLIGLSATAVTVIALTATPAHAAGTVDGSVEAAGTTCSWEDATTSDTPPNTLTVDHTTVDPTCDGGVTVTLSSSPTVTFDDTPPGTASASQIDVVATLFNIVNCGYRVSNATVTRQGTTGRTYTGGPFTATKISGGFLCPGSETVDSVTFSFS